MLLVWEKEQQPDLVIYIFDLTNQYLVDILLVSILLKRYLIFLDDENHRLGFASQIKNCTTISTFGRNEISLRHPARIANGKIYYTY